MQRVFRALAIPLLGSALLGSALLAESVGIRFVDIAAEAGVTAQNTYGGRTKKDFILETTGNGAAVFDYDGDGRNDILIANGTTFDKLPVKAAPSVHLYHNRGKGKFAEVGRAAGFNVEGWAQGVCIGDYDNDGHPDALVTYYGHNRLYRNTGQGFRDATADVKLPTTGTRFGSGCTFLDYDRDGRLDLFISNYVNLDLSKTPKPGTTETCKWKGIDVMCGPRGLPKARGVLYHANRDGTFTDVSEAAGILKAGDRYGLGAVTADFDDDGWPDIYVACDMTASLLFRNRGDGTFEERGVEAGVAYNYDGQLQAGMGIAVADFDGDGKLDIAKTNFSGDLPSLFRNEDGKFFTDVSREAGLGKQQLLGWGIAFIDADDDGWQDLIIANGHVYPEVEQSAVGDKYLQPTLLYRNLGNGRFEDITAAAGPAFATPRPARGLAVGDLDGDGRPEIVIVNMNGTPAILKNSSSGGNFINIRAEGTRSNRSAIGARLTVRAGGRIYIREVTSGTSFYSNNEPVLHFGLGSVAKIEKLEIRWPSGLRQDWSDLPVNRNLLVIEGKKELNK
ncbi:MAG: CRTAC1 family protein [Bryobacteraceae bacterium]|nr:CRTAC1 family protein [Bryobacteraceae bacterium]